MGEWREVIVDVSWLRVGRTTDWFELSWMFVFGVAFLAASYNWQDARKYAAVSKRTGNPTGRRLGPKDLRAAWFGVGKAATGLLIGTPLLFVPTGGYVGRADIVLASMLLRVGFIVIGSLICATAVNDFLFRRGVSRRNPSGPPAHAPRATV